MWRWLCNPPVVFSYKLDDVTLLQVGAPLRHCKLEASGSTKGSSVCPHRSYNSVTGLCFVACDSSFECNAREVISKVVVGRYLR